MQCVECGSEQLAGNHFCTKCGVRLSEVPAADTPSNQTSEGLVLSPSTKEEEDKILRELKEALKGVDPDKPEEGASPKLRLSSRSKLAVVGTAVALVILAVIGFEIGRRKGTEPAPLPPAPIETVLQTQPASPTIDDATRTTVGKMAAMLEAIDQYQKSKKGLPPSLPGINKSYGVPETLKDGWGQNFLYLVDLTNKTFILRSIGPDGRRESADDISVTSEGRELWLKEKEATIQEWQAANLGLHARLTSVGSAPEEPDKLEAARKLEEEKRRQEGVTAAAAQRLEQEQKRLEGARLEQEKRRQAEARRQEEERQAARAREEAQRQQQALRRAERLQENFINGLELWDAPATWEIIKDKETSALRVQGLGFLKKGQQWDNYKVEFELKINKESAGWVLRAQNSNNFYLFKLGSERAKAIPKNSLVKYIRSDEKYLNSLKREDAPGAAGVTPLSMKVRNRDYYRVMLTVQGPTITHYIDGIQVDAWNDDTFASGRFGFNASVIEQATIRSLTIEPLR